MTKNVLNGQKHTLDFVKQYGAATEVPITKASKNRNHLYDYYKA